MVVTLALLGMTAIAFSRTVSTHQARSQWDGVYTQIQADRGASVYAQSCATCHGGDLTGAEQVPALTGSEFSTRWNDHTLGELFEKMRTSMPEDEPGILNRAQYVDILSFILLKNGVPSGATELPDSDVLTTIKFVAVRPAAR
jgi:quinoprotein glucose dehydrogenase